MVADHDCGELRVGWRVNMTRVRRLYRLEGLQVRLRVRKRRHRSLHRGPVATATGLRQRWSMDFVHDQLRRSGC